MKPHIAVFPENTLKIEKLWLYICRDANGNEGVCAATMPNGIFAPLIAADQARLEQMTPMAEQLAGMARAAGDGRQIVLVEFSVRSDLRNITGPTS